jgi:hypothetical protein
MTPQIGRRAGYPAIIGVALVALAGCVQSPVPSQAMATAELALGRAELAGAAEHAPDELARAQAKLEAAQAAIRARAHEDARLLAEQAAIDARVAEAAARAAQTEAAADELRARLEYQHRQLALGTDGR